MIVYKYDQKTRLPIGKHTCQLDQRTGKYMRPRHCFDDAPPEYPDFVCVMAGVNGWFVDVERSRMAALDEIDQLHAQVMRNLTGNATIEERDTWSPKAAAARALVADTADPYQTKMLEDEAAERGLTALELADVVIAKASEFESLIGLAGAMRAKARAAYTAAETVEQMVQIGAAMHGEMAAKIAQRRAAKGDAENG